MSRIFVLIHGEKEISFISNFQIFSKNSFSTSAQLRINTKDSSEAWRKQRSGVFFTNPHGDAGSMRVIDPLSAPSKLRGWNLGKGWVGKQGNPILSIHSLLLISGISQLGWLLSWVIKQKDRGWFDAEE